MQRSTAALIGFAILPIVCLLLQRLWPANPEQPLLRRGMLSDGIWYVAQSYVARVVAPLATYYFLLPLMFAYGMTPKEFYAGFGPVAAIPFWWQVPIVFFLADFLSYWQHRMFHQPGFWPIHAVHHSSTELDWLSSGRFHPLNEIGNQLVIVAPVLALGFHPWTFLVLAPFTTWYAVVLHANLGWSFGPLRHVLASPIFHRWHHTSEDEGRDKNFAGILVIWDVLFGTFYMPRDRTPSAYGTSDPVPDGFVRQLAYPVLPKRRTSG